MSDKKQVIALILVFGVLTSLAVAQTFQITSLEEEVEEYTELVKESEPVTVGTGSESLDESMDDLPGMVGGC